MLARILTLLLALASAAALSAAPARPNVILIFIDDMGYGDVGFNGALQPKTPELDKLRGEGMRFNDFYVGCAVCSGSRTALMTGCHYQRLSMAAVLFPNSDKGLHPEEFTIAEMFKGAGYSTTCIGKWHLGHLPPCLPTYQGFDSYFGIPYSNDMWIDPANKTRQRHRPARRTSLLKEVESRPQIQKLGPPHARRGSHRVSPLIRSTITKRYTEEAIKFIDEPTRTIPFSSTCPIRWSTCPLASSRKAFAKRGGSGDELIYDAIDGSRLVRRRSLAKSHAQGRWHRMKRPSIIFTSDNGAAVGSSLPLRAKKGQRL